MSSRLRQRQMRHSQLSAGVDELTHEPAGRMPPRRPAVDRPANENVRGLALRAGAPVERVRHVGPVLTFAALWIGFVSIVSIVLLFMPQISPRLSSGVLPVLLAFAVGLVLAMPIFLFAHSVVLSNRVQAMKQSSDALMIAANRLINPDRLMQQGLGEFIGRVRAELDDMVSTIDQTFARVEQLGEDISAKAESVQLIAAENGQKFEAVISAVASQREQLEASGRLVTESITASLDEMRSAAAQVEGSMQSAGQSLHGADRMLRDLADEVRNSVEETSNLTINYAEQVAHQISTLQGVAGSAVTDFGSLAEGLRGETNSLADMVKAVDGGIRSFTDASAQQRARISGDLEEAIQEARRMYDAAQNGVSQMSEKTEQRLSEALVQVEEATQRLEHAAELSVTKLTNFVETAGEGWERKLEVAATQFVTTAEQAARDAEDAVDGLKRDLTGRLASVSGELDESIKEALAASFAKLESTFGDLDQRFETMCSNLDQTQTGLCDALGGYIDQMRSALREGAARMDELTEAVGKTFADAREVIDGGTAEAGRKLADAGNRFAGEIQSAQERLSENLVQQAKIIDDKLVLSSTRLADKIEVSGTRVAGRVEALSANVDHSLETLRSEVDRIRAARLDAMDDITSSLRESFGGVEAMMRHYVKWVATTVGTSNERVRSLSASIERALADSKGGSETGMLIAAGPEHEEMLDAVRNLRDRFDRAAVRMNDLLTSPETAAAGAHEALVDAAQQIVMEVERARNNLRDALEAMPQAGLGKAPELLAEIGKLETALAGNAAAE